MTDAYLTEILRTTRSVAVVGASPDPARPSHGVARYLITGTGYDVYLVNPHATEILGRPVYPSLAALPETPDLVDVFRRRTELPGVLADTLAVGARTLWLQLGLRDDEVVARAEAAGLRVVADRCLKVEHARLRTAA